MKQKSEKGLLSLEACVVVTLFIFFMLFIYSFFIVFETRNEMAHVVLATCNSLSLDTYETEKIENSGSITTTFFAELYGQLTNADSDPFVNHDFWYKIEKGSSGAAEGIWNGTIYATESGKQEAVDQDNTKAAETGKKNTTSLDVNGQGAYAVNTGLNAVIRERFLAYLADGDEKQADRILKRFCVVSGVDGLDFSASYISSGKLHIVLRYQIQYEFNAFNFDTISFEQSACSKLWAS